MNAVTSIQPCNRSRGDATLLIVDDSRTTLNALGDRLGQAGFTVVLCDRGSDALDLIAGCRFDLVLLDLMMPELSGMQVLAELRASPEMTDLPVLVLTGCSESDVAVRALNAGADDYVPKPFDFDVLIARIERILARSERLSALKRSNAVLDARIADRAIELGEARDKLIALRADRDRLAASVQALRREIGLMANETSAVG